MRNRHWLFTAVAALTWFTGRAQDKMRDKWVFQSFNTVGWIKGAGASDWQLQTVNGFRKERVFIGLGAGSDPYGVAGIPVFVDGRWYAGRHASSFFAYADAGLHMPTHKEPSAVYEISYTKGFYSDAGIGYGISLGKRTAAIITAGWTYKRVTETQRYWLETFVPPSLLKEDRYIYDLNRLVFKVGFRF